MKYFIDRSELMAWIENKVQATFIKPFEDSTKGETPEWKKSEADIKLFTEITKHLLSIPKINTGEESMTIQGAKDEVAKSHGYDILRNTKGWNRWDKMYDQARPEQRMELLNEVLALLSSQPQPIILPSDEEIDEAFRHSSVRSPLKIAEWFRSRIKVLSSDAVAFQKWLFENRYFETDANGLHIQTAQHGTIGESIRKTTEALYEQFKKG